MGKANGENLEIKLPAGLQTIRELSDDMLASDAAEHLEDGGTSVSLEIETDPGKVERELRAGPLGKVLLGEGHSLIWPYDDHFERNHDLIIGDVRPSAVEVTALARSWRSTPPFVASNAIVHHVRHNVGIGLWYGERTDEQKGDAVQYVGGGFVFDAYFKHADRAISRSVFAVRRAAADRHYRGHNQKQCSVNDPKLLAVTQMVRRLFELRPVPAIE